MRLKKIVWLAKLNESLKPENIEKAKRSEEVLDKANKALDEFFRANPVK